MSDRPPAQARADILRRIRGEYLEMPGLRLTCAQAVRLWAIDLPLCRELMEDLTHEHFLRRRDDGTYARAMDGTQIFPPFHAVKAGTAPTDAKPTRRHLH